MSGLPENPPGEGAGPVTLNPAIGFTVNEGNEEPAPCGKLWRKRNHPPGESPEPPFSTELLRFVGFVALL